MADLIGQTIGHYRIAEQLGQGGMATVYRAQDTRLDREVAIKFIRREEIGPAYLDQMLKRFEREAKSLARFSHPNIVKVYDYGEHEGVPYLVMEYLPGGTLKPRLGQPIPPAEAARLLVPIARALAYAHQQDIIHRDVKPANILVTHSGDPMLTDFGIAKILQAEMGLSTLTASGTGLGTPDYMAPEQWTNDVVPQTDIYALGVVFYEMVTGHCPYTGDTPAAVFMKQIQEPLPRPQSYVPDLPDEVERVLYKALDRDPKERYTTMGTFAAALEALTRLGSAATVPAAGKAALPTAPATGKPV
jgi:serine/threonine protein kinase